jgi:hypothetical protein
MTVGESVALLCCWAPRLLWLTLVLCQLSYSGELDVRQWFWVRIAATATTFKSVNGCDVGLVEDNKFQRFEFGYSCSPKMALKVHIQ